MFSKGAKMLSRAHFTNTALYFNKIQQQTKGLKHEV